MIWNEVSFAMSAIEEKIQSIGCNGLKMEIYKFIAPRCVFCNGGPETWMGEKFLPLDWDKKLKAHCRLNCCSKTCYYGMKLRKKEIYLHKVPSRFITRELISIAAENKMIGINFTVPDFIVRSQNPDSLSKMFKEIITNDYIFVRRIRELLRHHRYSTEEIEQVLDAEFYDYYIRNCQTSGDFLAEVPLRFLMTEDQKELCSVAIERDPLNLAFVPPQFFTNEDLAELLKLAVTKNGYALELIPVELYTYDLVLAAVTSKGDVIRYVPSRFFTEELFRVSLSTSAEAIDILDLVEFELDYSTVLEFATLAVSHDGFVLQRLPFFRINTDNFCIQLNDADVEKLSRLAVSRNGLALQYVPYTLLTPELVKLGVSNNGEALMVIPSHFLTPEIIQLGLMTTPEMISSTCENAFSSANEDSFSFGEEDSFILDKKHVTKEIAERAIKENGEYLRYIPARLKTMELCKLAIQNDRSGSAMTYVPSKYRTNEFLTFAIKKNPKTLEFMQQKEITIQMAILAVSKSEDLVYKTPLKYRKFLRDFFDLTE